MSILHVHVDAAVRAGCPCLCCIYMSVLHVDVYVVYPYPCCMFIFMLHVNAHATCPFYMPMSMLNVHILLNVHVLAEYPCPCCISMSMLHVHISMLNVYAVCPWPMSIRVQWFFKLTMLHVVLNRKKISKTIWEKAFFFILWCFYLFSTFVLIKFKISSSEGWNFFSWNRSYRV